MGRVLPRFGVKALRDDFAEDPEGLYTKMTMGLRRSCYMTLNN
jgi:hypothetical protein